ncbi:MAG: RloB family protein [Aromatoleum sp.]|jgi:hypothetical protein|uniref:RloB family protein n=1 Tax=Aromatoleum sp. TaxID=2307007 RepID=UPI002893C6B7|nr:RloB family protein [Aromatoleum sp.]MDT3669650.1 RloB family protein [Aromatoleum sp.]
MARDNSPRERQKKQLERKLGRRASYDRILIVSEGSKTEPNYFSEIRAAYRLHTANVEVRPSELGTAPIQVVQYAKELFENGDRHKNIQPRAFEQVYAVFDRDDHDSYFNALRLAESLDRRLKNDAKQFIRFKAIASVPSFELWLLLHYEDIQAPLHRDEVMQRLKQHIPGYEKGAGRAFAVTRERLAVATQRAEALAARFTADTAPEPYTAIVDLVKLLTTLRG